MSKVHFVFESCKLNFHKSFTAAIGVMKIILQKSEVTINEKHNTVNQIDNERTKKRGSKKQK